MGESPYDIAARARREAYEQAKRDDVVRALLEERQGYVIRAGAYADEGDERLEGKMRSRIAQVDEQLKLHDAADKIPAESKGRGRSRAAAADSSGDGS